MAKVPDTVQAAIVQAAASMAIAIVSKSTGSPQQQGSEMSALSVGFSDALMKHFGKAQM
jgi:hypothetical protein